MLPRPTSNNQEGFSLVEMVIAISVMLIIIGGVMSLLKGSMVISSATYEMTDAQENLRISQEYINRDLMNAGDGLKSMSVIRLPQNFVTNYLTLSPIVDPLDGMPTGVINFGILTSDNNVPASTTVVGAVPATTVRTLSDGTGTDRQTILEIDPRFVAISPSGIDPSGSIVTLPAGTVMSQFTVGEVYFFTSSLGGTFATITAISSPLRLLTFAVGGADLNIGLNTATNNNLKAISSGGTLATSMQRMQIIHYYVNSSNFLMRRVFGVQGATFRDSIIAEHVLNVQFKYSLETTDAAGNVVQPTVMLANKAQRLGARQVEVTISVETPHALQNNIRTNLTSTTSTSVRNMQFRQAVQPGS